MELKTISFISVTNYVLQVLEEHDLSCMELLHVKTDGVILTKRSKYFKCPYRIFTLTE